MKRVALIPFLALGLGTLAVAPANAVVCYSTTAACLLGANLGPGPEGAGVEGQAQNDFGVLGFSTNSIGVYGLSGTDFGLVGITQTADQGLSGVYGFDGSGGAGVGVLGSSASGTAVEATTTTGYGLVAQSSGTGSGILAQAMNEGDGVISFAQGGSAIFAASATGRALTGNSDGSVATLGLNAQGGGPLFQGEAGCGGSFCVTMDNSGNEFLFGSLEQNGATTVRTHSVNGDVATYSAQSAAPMLEDTGMAKLTSGVAFVALDKVFASTIAPGYEVFVTPHGDSNGLYTQATAKGFTVRENKAGRSTLAFDYRIVAKPLNAKGMRLAALSPMLRVTSAIRAPLVKRVALPRALPRVRPH